MLFGLDCHRTEKAVTNVGFAAWGRLVVPAAAFACACARGLGLLAAEAVLHDTGAQEQRSQPSEMATNQHVR